MNAFTPHRAKAGQTTPSGLVRICRTDHIGRDLPAGVTHVLIPSLLGELPRDVVHTADGKDLTAALRALRHPTLMDVVVDQVAPGDAVAPDAPFDQPGPPSPLDPRQPAPATYAAARWEDAASLGAWWGGLIATWTGAGLAGVRLLGLDRAPVAAVAPFLAALRDSAPGALLFAWTPGMSWQALDAIEPGSVDLVASSLPWWDGEAEWFWQEHEKLRRIAAVVSPVSGGRDLVVASALGDGLLLEADIRAPAPAPVLPYMTRLPLPGAVAGLLRTDHPDPRQAQLATLDIVNAGSRPVSVWPASVLVPAGGMFGPFSSDAGLLDPAVPLVLPPGAGRRFTAHCAAPPAAPTRAPATDAARRPRLAIEAVSPAVDGGQFPTRRVVGEVVTVEADVVGDGHDKLAAVLRWRAPGTTAWTETRMAPIGNDRFAGSFPLRGLGHHHFTISAWRDAFASFQDELAKKFAAGVPISLELKEGVLQVQRAAETAVGVLQAELRALAASLIRAEPEEQRVTLLSAQATLLMQRPDPRPLAATTERPFPVQAERSGARFASWYEVFPRSLSDDEHRHGTFKDVERHLPRVRAMGFDVLYFPPIHPIGVTNRKGRNNTLTPAPDDPGSPYAIGSELGGHDALLPELGTFDDLQALRAAAAEHGIELAIDFAIQCSPDHPWLKQHKDWFNWRPDGTIRYAENPPKKYEDIVNVDFYAPGAVPGLWDELCNVVMFWAEHGIRLFRVDNPHTKPLPFWEWLIAQVQARFPDTVFLAEAFTRPKVMYRLAKVGFSQSYTYFTWRNTKAEFTQYMTELATEALREYFRPHFFVNTPDINPVPLQTSGRPGYLIRAALAATLSGLWGVYNGFELCEGTPIPGREEYLDSEKYQLRAWEWDRPGNIVPEITALNRLRRENPALQTHLGITFLDAASDDVLFFEKATPDKSNILLIAIALDLARPAGSALEFPFWRYGGTETTAFELDDLLGGGRLRWTGRAQSVQLTQSAPYAIWRLRNAA